MSEASQKCLGLRSYETQTLITMEVTPEQVECLKNEYHIGSADFNFKIQSPSGLTQLTSVDDLVKYRKSFYLFDFYHDRLLLPEPGLKELIRNIRELSGGKKITTVFPNISTLERGGYYMLGVDGPVTIHDTMNVAMTEKEWSTKSYVRMQTPFVLYHELGHKLMQLVYGGEFPSYEGHRGHDKNKNIFLQKVPLGAAWSEGFASAMGTLDFGFPDTPQKSEFYFSKEWHSRTVKDKLSNEWAIALVLREFMGVCEKDGRSEYCKADLNEAKKIINVMKESGLQKNFQEFLVDYVSVHPKDKPALLIALKGYGFVRTEKDERELFDCPSFKERAIAKFIEKHEEFSTWSLVLPSAARAKKWEEFKEQGVVAKLTSKDFPLNERHDAMKRLEVILERVAKGSIQIDL